MASSENNAKSEALYRLMFRDGYPILRRNRRLFSVLPANRRCRVCNAPFEGAGGLLVRTVMRRRRSNLNPGMCNVCDDFVRDNPGGAEIELTFLFADVRGSTAIAESMSAAEFGRLMDRFYSAATQVMMETDGLIDKFVGDEIIALFAPGVAGPDHARQAIEAAQAILEATGHRNPDGPWLPMGAGVHTGSAFLGSFGTTAGTQLTAVGDAVNTTARLASNAASGEILVSDAAYHQAGLQLDDLERRDLQLKGRSESIGVCVLRVQPAH